MTNKQTNIENHAIKLLKIAVLAITVFFLQTTANAQPSVGKLYRTIPVSTNKCMDVAGLSQNNGAPIQQWDCFEGNKNQWWELRGSGTPGGYALVAKHSGKCLDAKDKGTVNGTPIIQWDCNNGGDATNQVWLPVKSGNYFQIVNIFSAKCLDVTNASKDNGAKLILYDCNQNKLNQLFRFQDVSKMPDTYNPPASDTSGKPNSLRISTGYGFKEIPQTTVTMSDKKDLDNGGKYVEYTVNNIPSNTLGAQGGVANIKLRPKAAIKDGLLYVFLTTEDSSIAIDQRKLKNTTTARGYYLDALKINITADQNLEVDKHGPENVNASGSITDMKQFDVGLSKDGPSVNYSFGSQTTRNFNDFGFTDFKINNMVEGYWQMTPDIVVKTAGQFSSLNAPPVLASSNFPIYEQVIFKAKDSNYLPDKVTLNVQLRPMFKKQILINNQSSDVQAFFEGFGVLFNPKTYSGELVYRLGVDSLANELIYSITLDLTPLKR